MDFVSLEDPEDLFHHFSLTWNPLSVRICRARPSLVNMLSKTSATCLQSLDGSAAASPHIKQVSIKVRMLLFRRLVRVSDPNMATDTLSNCIQRTFNPM